MDTQTHPLLSSVMDHFERECKMLAEMIQNIPDEQWMAGERMPAKHVMHIVVGAEVFVNDIPLEQWDASEWLGVEARPGGPWNLAGDEVWSKPVALGKLAEMRKRVAASLSRLDDAALLEPESVQPWTGAIRLGKLLYELRHIQHHLGAISTELKRAGVQPFARWD